MMRRFWFLSAVGILLCGCDMEQIGSELQEVGAELGLSGSTTDPAPVTPAEPEPKPLPDVPPEHLALLETISDAAQQRLERTPLTDIGPELHTGKFLKWHYSSANNFRSSAKFVRTEDPLAGTSEDREIASIEFTVNAFRNQLGCDTEREAATSRINEKLVYQLAFTANFSFENDHWKFQDGRWGLATIRSEMEPIEPGTSHHKLCEMLFVNGPTLP